MERKLNYILSAEGVSPSEKLFGGTQGENRATAIVVTPDSSLLSAINEQKNKGQEVFCTFDVLSETGEFFEGEKRKTEDISKPFYLTEAMTASGLDVTVIVKIGFSESCFYKAQIKLYFEECPTYKPLNLKKKNEQERFEERAEEIFSLLEQKAEDAERKLDVKCNQAASSAALAAGHLDKTIAFSDSAQTSSQAAAESEAAARQSAEAAEKDFETVKGLFASAVQNINNHNFDPTSHADIRGQIDLANDRIDSVAEDFNILEKQVAKEIAEVNGAKPLKLLKSMNIGATVTDIIATFQKGLKEIFIKMKIGFDANEGSIALCCRSDGGQWYMLYESITVSNTQRYYYVHAKEQAERNWETFAQDVTVPNNNGTNYATAKIAYSTRNESIPRYPKELNFFMAGRNTRFTAGTTIEIWGVEADE